MKQREEEASLSVFVSWLHIVTTHILSFQHTYNVRYYIYCMKEIQIICLVDYLGQFGNCDCDCDLFVISFVRLVIK